MQSNIHFGSLGKIEVVTLTDSISEQTLVSGNGYSDLKTGR